MRGVRNGRAEGRLRGMPELAAAFLCLLVTAFLLTPRGAAALRFMKGIAAAQRNGTVPIRLSEPEDAERAVSCPSDSASETQTAAETTSRHTESETAAEDADDIAAYRTEYLNTVASLTPKGSVRESFFGNGAATDTVGNVAVRNCTSTKKPDFAALLEAGAALSPTDPSQPAVLIYHTHTTESYLPAYDGSFYAEFKTRTKDPAKNMVRVGDAVAAALEAAGIGVLHDTAVYDETYNGAYARSRETAERYLAAYPSLQITLDVHRDAIYFSDSEACKPTVEIDGKKTAQIMIITGAEEGLVSSFPKWEENLRFALALQNKAQTLFPGLMKPVYFCQRRYNMDLTPCSLLLEFGSDTNTLEEAVRAGRLLGEALAALIKENEKT